MTGSMVTKKKAGAADPALRTYQLAEQQYQTVRTASNTLAGASVVLLYVCAFQAVGVFGGTFFVLHLTLFVFCGTGGTVLLCVSRQMRRMSRILKSTADEQRALADDLVTWFVTTYSCDQIDRQIEAITTINDSNETDFLKRMDMIRILVTREYSRSLDEVFLTQLCEDVYRMLYGAVNTGSAEN